MRFAIYGVVGVVLAVVLGVVGYVVYNSVRQSWQAATGQPVETAPGMGAGPGDHPLSLPLRCVNRVERRALESRARYASWVDLEAGPSCQERHAVHGVHPLHADATGLCEQAASWARTTGASALADALDALAAAYPALLDATTEAAGYYGEQQFAADGCARGKALHPTLVEGYAKVLAASAVTRAAMHDYAVVSNDVLRARVRAEHGLNSGPLFVLDLLDALDAVAGLYADGALGDDELGALDGHAERILSLHARLRIEQKKRPMSKPRAGLVDKTDALVKKLRTYQVRRGNGTDPSVAERNTIEREARAALRAGRRLDFEPVPVLLYAD